MTTTTSDWNGIRADAFRADPYPGQRPDGSFLVDGATIHELRASDAVPSGWALRDGTDVDDRLGAPGLADRYPVLAYGSNANPAMLARRFPAEPVVALRATTTGLAAAWCTDPRSDGQIPATLVAVPGAVETHVVLLCTATQLDRLDRFEGRAHRIYDLGVLRSGAVVLDDRRRLPGVLTYVGGRGRRPLAGPGGAPVRVGDTDQATAAMHAARRPGACGPEFDVDVEVIAPGVPFRGISARFGSDQPGGCR